jgi:hypothetical protein
MFTQRTSRSARRSTRLVVFSTLLLSFALVAAPASADGLRLQPWTPHGSAPVTGGPVEPSTPAGDPSTHRGSGDLVLVADPVKVPLGGKTELTVEVAAFDGTNMDVDIYRRTAGGSEQFLRTVTFGGQGRATTTVRDLKYDTRFRAEWSGDLVNPAAEDTALTRVKSKVNGRLLRFQRKKGNLRLYKQGKPVFFLVKVLPNHDNDPIAIRFQAFVRGHWRNLEVFRGRLNPDSLAGVKLGTRRAPTGVKFRFRGEFGGRYGNLPDNSPWATFAIFD